MAYDIGPRISLKGDAEFKSAINSANSALKDYGSQLKAVNAEMEANGKTSELLEKKGELLQKQYDEQTKKLKAYNDAIDRQNKIQEEQKKKIDELTKEFGENSKEVQKAKKEYEQTTENIRKLSQGANETQAFISKLGGEIRDCASETEKFNSKIQQTADKLDEIGKKSTELGNTLTKNVTAPIVAVGTASVVAFNDLDQSLDIVVKKTGASGEALEEMEQIVKDIGSTVPASFDDIASAVGEVNTRFGLQGDELEDLSEQFVKFAKLNDTDVSTSIDQVQKSLSAFGLSTDQASALLDTMNAASQMTGVSVDTLTSGLIQNAAAFQEMGLDINQSILLMAQMEKSGANSETVMQGLRKALKNATAEGKDMNTALAELEDSILNGADGVDGLTKSYEIFGKSGDQIYNAIKNGSLSFQDLADMAVEADGSVSDTFENTKDGAEQFELAMQNLKLAGAELGEEIMKTLGPILEDLVGIIKGVTEWFSGLTDGQKQIILAIVGVIAAIGPALVAFGKVATGISSIMKTAEMLKGFIDLSMLGPAGIIMLIIGALILLYTKCEWFRDGVNAIVQAVVDFFKNAMDGIIKFFTETVPNVFNGVINFFKENWQGLLLLIVNPFAGAFKLLYDNCEGFRNFIDNLVNDVINFFKKLPEKATKWGKDMLDNFINGITSKLSKLWDTVKDVGKGIADFLGFSVPEKGPLSDADKWMPDMIDLMVSGIDKNKSKLTDAVRGLAGDMELNPDISGSATITGMNTINLNVVGQVDGRAVMQIVDTIALGNLNGLAMSRGGM